MSAPYSVGYGKPPKKSQFQKGKSGNPSGRPKQRLRKPPLDLHRNLIVELKSPMTIFEDGKKKKVAKLEVLLKTLIARALQGDKTATKQVIDFAQKLPKDAFTDDEIIGYTTKSDLEKFQKFLDEAAKKYM
jgi:Family of unknown function (DUF5681)